MRRLGLLLRVSALTLCALGFAPRSASAAWADIAKRWPTSTLSVCWMTAGHDTEKGWVKDVIEDSWSSVSALRFTGWGMCNSSPSNIRIQVGCPASGCVTKIGTDANNFPNTQTMMVPDKDAPSGCPAGTSQDICVKGLAVNAMGFAIGLVPEQNRPDRPAGCAHDPSPLGTFTIGSWDNESVMNTGTNCSQNGSWFNNGLLGKTDIMAAQQLYGAGTAPVVLESGTERQISTMNPAGVYSFVSLATVSSNDLVVRGGRNNTVMFYNPQSGGLATTGSLTSAGVLTLSTAPPKVVGIGWSDITAVQNGYFIFYAKNQEGGLVSVRRVNAKGDMTGEVAHLPNQGTNWSRVVGLPNGAVLFYDSVALTGRTARLNALGTQLIPGVNLSGFFVYDRLAAVNLNTVLFIQNTASGTGNSVSQISTIDELGTYAFATFVSGVPGSVGVIAGSRNGSVLFYDTTFGMPSGRITGKVATISSTGQLTFTQSLTDFHSFNYGNIAAD